MNDIVMMICCGKLLLFYLCAG